MKEDKEETKESQQNSGQAGKVKKVMAHGLRGVTQWRRNGKLHRDGDKPAQIGPYGKFWYRDGEIHRDGDKPAIIRYGDKYWFRNGKEHRDGDKPAYIGSDGHKAWYRDGKEHRDGGKPAVIYPKGEVGPDGKSKEWHRNGVQITKYMAKTPVNEWNPKHFLKIKNAETRREFIKILGIEKIQQALGSKIIDKYGDYELHLINLKGTTGKWPYLKMKNPSIGCWHMEAVAKGCKTVQQALEWRNGTKEKPTVLT